MFEAHNNFYLAFAIAIVEIDNYNLALVQFAVYNNHSHFVQLLVFKID